MKIGAIVLIPARFLLRKGWRGGTWLTKILAASLDQLQLYEVSIPGGTLYVDLRKASAYGILVKGREYTEEHHLMKLCVHPNDVVYDIGANHGIYTVWLSSLVGQNGKVFAFEPNLQHHQVLRKTMMSLPNAVLLEIALCDVNETLEFYVPEDDTMASLRDWTNHEETAVTKVACQGRTLNSLIGEGSIPHPDFIKCDIEGAELLCFRGGNHILDHPEAPIVLFEANINSTAGFGLEIGAALDCLKSYRRSNYDFFYHDDHTLKPISAVPFLHGNILAVPASKMGRLCL